MIWVFAACAILKKKTKNKSFVDLTGTALVPVSPAQSAHPSPRHHRLGIAAQGLRATPASQDCAAPSQLSANAGSRPLELSSGKGDFWKFVGFSDQGQASQPLAGIELRGSAALLERQANLEGSRACTADRRYVILRHNQKCVVMRKGMDQNIFQLL